MPRPTIRAEHRDGCRMKNRGQEQQQGNTKAVQIEIPQGFPVHFGKLPGAGIIAYRHRESGVPRFGFMPMSATAIVAAVGQNAFADRLIYAAMRTLDHHFRSRCSLGRLSSRAGRQCPAQNPEHHKQQHDQDQISHDAQAVLKVAKA